MTTHKAGLSQRGSPAQRSRSRLPYKADLHAVSDCKPDKDAEATAEVSPKAADQQTQGPPEEPKVRGVPVKWLSLVLLTLQTSGQALLIRWSKSHDSGVPYLSSTAVFFTEVLKTCCSLALVVVESGGVREAGSALARHFTENPRELLKAAVPSLVYTLQNNLMFYSIGKLGAPVQQVLYQMKILTTAGLGVLVLGRRLTATKWASCFMLLAGVVLVQWPRPLAGEQGRAAWSSSSDQLKGFLAVFTGCFTSGFASVYTQRMLQQTTASVWMRNVQIGLFGSIMGLTVAFASDGQKIAKDGFLQGYSSRVVRVIAMNALGGLLCAVMLKYAGATLGCFSTAMSIILTAVLSWTMLQDFTPDAFFVLGALLAITASLMYALGLPAPVSSLCGRKPESKG